MLLGDQAPIYHKRSIRPYLPSPSAHNKSRDELDQEQITAAQEQFLHMFGDQVEVNQVVEAYRRALETGREFNRTSGKGMYDDGGIEKTRNDFRESLDGPGYTMDPDNFLDFENFMNNYVVTSDNLAYRRSEQAQQTQIAPTIGYTHVPAQPLIDPTAVGIQSYFNAQNSALSNPHSPKKQ